MQRIVLGLFFLSGACGLVYQVVWTRMMTHVFGTTAVAVGTVLAAFMSGLAAGAWILGKAADRSRNSLRFYAWLEFGVGLTALGAHLLLDRITPIYLAVHDAFGGSTAALGLARFILAFVFVMLPTLLMGATLPVIARFVTTHLSTVGAGLSAVYAANTVGAVAGALTTGFYLIGAYGIHATVYLAVLGNLAVGTAAWALSARTVAEPTAPAPRSKKKPAPGARAPAAGPAVERLLLIGFGISGFTSFAYEIYWTRSLVFLMGNSTYAVTTMLTAFLAGLALGGYLVRHVVDRLSGRIALFGAIQILIGISSAAALPLLFLIADPQVIHTYIGELSDRLGLLVAARFGLSLVVMLVPATLIGATFPLVGRILVRDLASAGATIGRVYAVNTFGNVVGALLPGLVLLHWFGIQRGILLAAALNTLVGCLLLFSPAVRSTRLRWTAVAVVTVAALVIANTTLGFQFPTEGQTQWQRVLFYDEGPSATTKVLIDPETREKLMSVDGVVIGGTGFTDFKQQLLAHLPKLLLEDVSTELSVGLGSAILVGESARHREVREITCVEIAPSVVAAAAWFERENHGALADARIRIVEDDVANHMRTTPATYRVISADEKTAQDYASNGFSYSLDYYELLRNRLAPGGMVIQWVPTDLPANQYTMVLKTFTESFPRVQLWYFLPGLNNGPSNTILIGSNARIGFDTARMLERWTREPAAFAGIDRYGLNRPEAVLTHYVADEETLRPALVDAAENTLAHPRYEFYSPRDYAPSIDERLAINHDFIVGLRRTAAPAFLAALATDGPTRARLNEALVAEERYALGYRQTMSGAADSVYLASFDAALALAPWNDSLRRRVFLRYWNAASHTFTLGNPQKATGLLRQALSIYGGNAHARVEYAILLMQNGAPGPAAKEAGIAVELDPQYVLGRQVLADSLARIGRRAEAADQLRALLEIEPDHAAAREALALF